MRLQFASDLHLNSWAFEKIPFEKILQPVADSLILCGDIGAPDSTMLAVFFKWCSKRWKQIFWIPGHHELTTVWHLKTETYEQCIRRMQNLVAVWDNIQVLDREAMITEDGILFLACPLWSRLTAMSHEMSKDPICQAITRRYEGDLEWLRSQIKTSEIPVVIATHYPPTATLMDARMVNDPLTVPFALETEVLLRPPVVAWVCGYLHKAVQIHKPWMDAEGRAGTVLMVTNPRGYPEDSGTGFRLDAVLRLEGSSGPDPKR